MDLNILWFILLGVLLTGYAILDGSVYCIAGFGAQTQWYRNIVADPVFVDAAAGDFRLQWSSPCINAGLAIAGINDSYQGTAPDIGCFEKS